MIKFVFKWMFRLFLLGVIALVVLVVAFVLLLDPALRLIAQHNIRAQTGMDVEIGSFHLGLTEPVVTIKDLKIYNSPEFGSAPFLNIPEIHVEYDREALARRQLHLTLLRFNLGELDIVKNEAGQTNIFSLGLGLPAVAKPADANASLAEFKKRTGLAFEQIDVLNVSVGKAKYIDLKNPRNNREQKIGIDNFPVRHVKSMADLSGLAVLLALRSGDFFGSLVAPAPTK